jgi:hypothetical protein
MGASAELVGEQIRDLGNWSGNFKRRPRAACSGEETQQGAVGQQKRGGPGEHAACSRGDDRLGGGEELGGHCGRHVATHAGDIVKLVPQMQKELFHGAKLYGSTARTDVRALTLAWPAQRLAGAFRRA